MTPEIIIGVVALILGPTGGVYVGIRAGLNGTRESVRRIEMDTKVRLSRIEEKVDDIASELPSVRERVSLLEHRMGAEERRA